jgi:signal transduction histidine kinase
MNRLIQDLLDVARIEAGRMYLERDYLQPANLVREAVELNAVLAAAKALTLRPEGGDATSPVLADRDRVLQVLANLIGNAIKFTPSGGEITVRAEPVNGEICFSVADSGPGIREDDLTRLFRPFWQGRRGGREGAGLGLTIAKGIVEAHGGRIWATSEPGAGATLCFTLPAAEERRGGTDSTADPGEA